MHHAESALSRERSRSGLIKHGQRVFVGLAGVNDNRQRATRGEVKHPSEQRKLG